MGLDGRARGSDLLLTGVRVIDGTGAPPRPSCSIRIRNGRIVEIADRPIPDDERVLDARGATVLPGIIDSHVHLQSVPGSAWRGDTEADRWDAIRKHLRAYLACGVTTVLDAAIAAPVLRRIRMYLQEGGNGPRYLALAPAFYPPDGYLDHNYLTDAWGPMWSPAAAPADIEDLFAAYDGIDGIVGVKVVIEHGFSPFYDWEIHSPEMRDRIRDAAEARGLPTFVHALQHRDHLIAMEMAPRALMHSGFLDRQPSDELIARMREHGTCILTTFASLFDYLLMRPSFLRGIEDPLILATVPEKQRRTVENPKAWQYTWRRLFRTTAPRWMPDRLCNLVSALVMPAAGERPIRRGFADARRAIRSLHGAGIPVVMATDAGAWPLFPACFHGYSTVREMELMAGMGFDPMAVIEASTRVPATMLGLQERIGTVEVGKEADLVVLDEDPLVDMGAMRSIRWTIRGGEVRTPAEWMEDHADRSG